MYFLKKSEVISYLFKKYRALTIYLLDYYATGQGSSLHIYARGGISLIGCQIMILMNKKMDRQFFIICDSYRYEKTTFPRMYMKFSRNYIRAPTNRFSTCICLNQFFPRIILLFSNLFQLVQLLNSRRFVFFSYVFL